MSLLDAAQKPKFIVVSSIGGSTSLLDKNPLSTAPYGASKAAVNHVTRKIHFEHPNIIAIPLSPGWVDTDVSFDFQHGGLMLKVVKMGQEAAGSIEKTEIPTSLEDGVAEIVVYIDNATREKDSGKFGLAYWEGEEVTW
jgi:norsolorinic acid ketoreductase